MAQVVANNTSSSYTFASQPRAVQQRKKYKMWRKKIPIKKWVTQNTI